MIRLTFVFNAIHLEAARRLRRGAAPEPWVRRTWAMPVLQVLVLEGSRLRLEPDDRQLWPLRLRIQPTVMVALALFTTLGLVGEVRLPHLRGAGRALRWLVGRCPRLLLLDDGLDQYRAQPRALDPGRFPLGTPLALFSDQRDGRAPWCERFHVLELGPLYLAAPCPIPLSVAPPAGATPGTLIVDSPGVERLMATAERLPRPWLVLPHPVRSKRSWRLPCTATPEGSEALIALEQRIARCSGLIVVGESMALLAALALRPAGSPLLVALPTSCDPHLRGLVTRLASRDQAVSLV
ncbi:hypothetical protein [Synechococcus sp. CBW1107]|uniref:hypothetical protein n=1 Tax=Synechococcus sp. CBW1107 TaxID=2789857 RepID=UPI002AD484C4|nr:hypothetical protein [Synechococcus sp. CBW1107]